MIRRQILSGRLQTLRCRLFCKGLGPCRKSFKSIVGAAEGRALSNLVPPLATFSAAY